MNIDTIRELGFDIAAIAKLRDTAASRNNGLYYEFEGFRSSNWSSFVIDHSRFVVGGSHHRLVVEIYHDIPDESEVILLHRVHPEYALRSSSGREVETTEYTIRPGSSAREVEIYGLNYREEIPEPNLLAAESATRRIIRPATGVILPRHGYRLIDATLPSESSESMAVQTTVASVLTEEALRDMQHLLLHGSLEIISTYDRPIEQMYFTD